MKITFSLITILALFTFCSESIELAVPEDQEYLVYNQSVEARPLEGSNGFFAITLNDSVPWLINIEPSGKLNPLLNLSSYFPESINYDSIVSLNASHIGNENIMVGFSYNYIENNSTHTMIKAFEIQQHGTIVDELNYEIPSYMDNTFQFTAISKNTSNNWVLISSYSDEQMGPNAESTLYIQTSIFNKINDTIEVINTIDTYSELLITDAYTLHNGNITIVLSESNKNLPPDIQNGSSFSILKITPDGNSQQINLEDSYSSIEVVKQIDNELLIVGTVSRTINESNIKIISVDNSDAVQWYTDIQISSSFTPTCINLTNNSYVIGGLNGDTRDFSWNNVYAQTNNTLAMYVIAENGEITSNINQETEFSSLVVGVCAHPEGFTWLIAKNSFDTYKNLAILKTDFFGNIN